MSQKCVTACGEGFYKGQGITCGRCQLKCKTCKDKPDSCTSCDFPYFYSSSDCVTKCPPGFYGNTKERLCKPCDKKCQTCSNGETGDKCQSCPNGLFLSKLPTSHATHLTSDTNIYILSRNLMVRHATRVPQLL